MGTLIDKLNRIKQTKNEIKDAINQKGAVCNTSCFREYPNKIIAIPSGGGNGGGSGDSIPAPANPQMIELTTKSLLSFSLLSSFKSLEVLENE